MSVYAISDLHLSLSVDKPMDVFGGRWVNYMERLEENWRAVVGEGDTVLMPGDISWATYLSDASADFGFINSLPGKKLISKGNHDYWWTTAAKLNQFLVENKFDSIKFLHNNSFRADNIVVCGTRGWIIPGEEGFGADDSKVYERELQRLELSFNSANRKEADIMVAQMHFPVCNRKGVFAGFLEIMKKHKTDLCIYGHLHSHSLSKAFEGEKDGVKIKLVSADHLEFKPWKVDLEEIKPRLDCFGE